MTTHDDAVLSARILGQLMLMQSVVTNLPNEESIFSFVCRGLIDLPGVANVKYEPTGTEPVDARSVRFPLRLGNLANGAIVFTVSDREAFKPYEVYLNNFCFMVAVILEERDQRRRIELHQSQLEERIQERTRQLSEEIVERQHADEALIASEKEFRLLAESMPVIVWITRPDGWNVYFNHQWVDYTGLTMEESNGHGWNIPFHPDDQQRAWNAWQNAVAANGTYTVECRLRRKDGVYRWWLIRGVPVRDAAQTILKWFGTCTDIDEMKQAEEALLVQKSLFFQAQKVQSIGTLAGGIAHDFNNILAIILGYAAMLEDRRTDPEKFTACIATIMKAVDRGAALVQQILTFARKTDVLFVPLTIPDFLRDIIAMLRETFPKTITFHESYGPGLPEILGDRTQIHQVLLNLCVNARDAMPNGGAITIAAAVRRREDLQARFPVASDEHYMCISVEDTGEGMDEETKLRVFDPFFTTKDKGKGTGLGLSVVYGVMQSHRGFVDVESVKGRGTTFSLYLPSSPMPNQNSEREAEANVPLGGTETLLIIEDEDSLNEMVAALLRSKGYRIITAHDGQEGVLQFSANKDVIDAVLTDIGLPIINGIEVFKKVKEIDPGARVVLASGFFEPGIKEELERGGAKGFITKPYKLNDVLLLLRQVLDAPGVPESL